MKSKLTGAVLTALLLAGCGGGGGYGGGGNGGGGGTTPPPPGPTTTSFTGFVKTQLAQTSDTTEPAAVNDVQFDVEENETAFDDVLSQ